MQETNRIKQESLLNIYEANRLVGDMRLIIVTTADRMNRHHLVEEYYVFHRCPDVPFLYLRTHYSPEDPRAFDFGLYPNMFCAQSLLDRSFQKAKDRFQFEIRRHDRELHRELFSPPTPMNYDATNDQRLVEFQM